MRNTETSIALSLIIISVTVMFLNIMLDKTNIQDAQKVLDQNSFYLYKSSMQNFAFFTFAILISGLILLGIGRDKKN